MIATRRTLSLINYYRDSQAVDAQYGALFGLLTFVMGLDVDDRSDFPAYLAERDIRKQLLDGPLLALRLDQLRAEMVHAALHSSRPAPTPETQSESN